MSTFSSNSTTVVLIKLLVNKYYRVKNKQTNQTNKQKHFDKMHKLCLPIDILLELLDQLVLPILLYGCEVWGFGDTAQTEMLYRKYIEILLGAANVTPNVVVYGERGTIPIMNLVKSRMRLVNGKMSKLPFTMYRLMRQRCEIDNDCNPNG